MPLVQAVKYECPYCWTPIYFRDKKKLDEHLATNKHRGTERRKKTR